eukprot:TRINITY_DN15555_c0_g1_i1.p1 TRINITY_DN15555_c0_g1~~TRINITY_DN15555_c0_g1_i1.p1  ORF type:complete len:367 (+),score=121.30 TRINITY_DN15555_c0_g1_i1:53-1102(+)
MAEILPVVYPLTTGAVVVAVLYGLVWCVLGAVAGAVALGGVLAAFAGACLYCGKGYRSEDVNVRRKEIKVTMVGKGERSIEECRGDEEVEISVVVPCYNEEKRIEKMVKETVEYLKEKQKDRVWEIVVADDGSTDNSVMHCLKLAVVYGIEKQLKIVKVRPNRGKGYAVKQGVFASSGSLILMADADAASDINEFAALEATLNKSTNTHIAIGSRAHMEEESKASRTPLRTLLMHIFHFCVVFTFAFAHKHTAIRDSQCGFKLFTREAAFKTFSNLRLERWAFDVELLVVASILGYKVSEVQIKWEEIEGSKMSLKGMIRMGLELLLTCVCVRFGLWTVRDVAVPKEHS